MKSDAPPPLALIDAAISHVETEMRIIEAEHRLDRLRTFINKPLPKQFAALAAHISYPLVPIESAAHGGASRPSPIKQALLSVVRAVIGFRFSEPFRKPVNPRDAPNYLDIIKSPIDLSTIQSRVAGGEIADVDALLQALLLMASNAAVYNGVDSPYHDYAQQVVAFARKKIGETALLAPSLAVSTPHRRRKQEDADAEASGDEGTNDSASIKHDADGAGARAAGGPAAGSRRPAATRGGGRAESEGEGEGGAREARTAPDASSGGEEDEANNEDAGSGNDDEEEEDGEDSDHHDEEGDDDDDDDDEEEEEEEPAAKAPRSRASSAARGRSGSKAQRGALALASAAKVSATPSGAARGKRKGATGATPASAKQQQRTSKRKRSGRGDDSD